MEYRLTDISQDYNYDIYKELLENVELYKEAISCFRQNKDLNISVVENLNNALKIFNINYKDLKEKLVVPDNDLDNKRKYLYLTCGDTEEKLDLF